MKKRVLITGGAGFIGSHLSQKLTNDGFSVTIYDNFSEQIHGKNEVRLMKIQSYSEQYDLIVADINDRINLSNAIKDVDFIVHLAAETGTGQSMYEIRKYTSVNIEGTSLIWDILSKEKHQVQKVVIASSRSIYGEGKYICNSHGIVFPKSRIDKDMLAGDFEVKCPICSSVAQILPTDEESKIHPNSLYGLTKQMQEQMSLLIGKSIDIPTISLRFQNVYGPGQSLSNPYTGILSIFSTSIKNNNDINVFEDGKESRDFVYIDDVIDAIQKSLVSKKGNYLALNVGSGKLTTVEEVAKTLIHLYKSDNEIYISGNYRIGDIRSNYSDNKLSSEYLDFKPKWEFKDGIKKFTDWVNKQELQVDNFKNSIEELKSKGLFR
jgi:dTDP-L-rhamnose 4-epimerase